MYKTWHYDWALMVLNLEFRTYPSKYDLKLTVNIQKADELQNAEVLCQEYKTIF